MNDVSTSIIVEHSTILNTKPDTLPVIPENIPAELKAHKRWCCWRYENKQNNQGQWRWTKVPYDPISHLKAKSNDPKTWTSFDEALGHYQSHSMDGIGFFMVPTDPIQASDIDHCRNGDGKLNEVAQEWVSTLNSYAELSPSAGLRIFARGVLPIAEGEDKPKYRKPDYEMYDCSTSKYLTVTGQQIEGTPNTVEKRQEQIETLYHKYIYKPSVAIDKPKQSSTTTTVEGLPKGITLEDVVAEVSQHDKYGPLWRGDMAGYNSQSEADQALANGLWFYTHSREAVDALFRRSGLYREKWDRRDYRARTLQRASTGDLATNAFNWSAVLRAKGDKAVSEVEPWPEEYIGQAPAYSSPKVAEVEVTKITDQPWDDPYLGEDEYVKDVTTADKPKAKGTSYTFQPLNSRELDEAIYHLEWLVKGLLVKNQPIIAGGPKKSMKTSCLVDLNLSFGSGLGFLGTFWTKKTRSILISGESGQATIQETARRIARAKGVSLADTDCYWDYRLPRLSVDDEIDQLAEGIKRLGIQVAIIDPLYLCLLSGDTGGKQASNLYDMGPLLLQISSAILSVGATPILAHHARKNLTNPDQPLDLEDLAFSGVAEFARQWMLLNRRERYEGDGKHKLWVSGGGSVGHGGTWAVDIDEGTLDDDFTGRKWEVIVKSLSQFKEDKQAAKQAEKDAAHAERKRLLVATVKAAPEPYTKSALYECLGWNRKVFDALYDEMLEERLITVKGAVVTDSRGRKITKHVVGVVNEQD